MLRRAWPTEAEEAGLEHQAPPRRPFDLVLSRYAVERVLYRLAKSTYASMFVVKGATLFTVWSGEPHRATRDLDLLGKGDGTLEGMEQVFREVLTVKVPDDGLEFDTRSVRATRIKEDADYEGVRLQFVGTLAGANVPVQVDVGFGDAIVPAPLVTTFPMMLDHPAPKLRAYSRETVVAEKVHAMVLLDVANQ